MIEWIKTNGLNDSPEITDNKLFIDRVMSIENNDNIITISEQCDDYYYIEMDMNNSKKLLHEISKVMNPSLHKYKVITLCGSTKFKDEFIEIQKQLTLAGNIVLTVGLFGHSGDPEAFEKETKEMLDDMHKSRIDMSHAIFVINKNGYIGSSTLSEIQYAIDTEKEIISLEPIDWKSLPIKYTSSTDELKK